MALFNSYKSRKEGFNRLSGALVYLNPANKIEALRKRVELLNSQMEHLLIKRIEILKLEFSNNAGRLEVLSPLRTLARGYSIATSIKSGLVITDVGRLFTGEQFQLTLHRGKAICRVEELET